MGPSYTPYSVYLRGTIGFRVAAKDLLASYHKMDRFLVSYMASLLGNIW